MSDSKSNNDLWHKLGRIEGQLQALVQKQEDHANDIRAAVEVHTVQFRDHDKRLRVVENDRIRVYAIAGVIAFFGTIGAWVIGVVRNGI